MDLLTSLPDPSSAKPAPTIGANQAKTSDVSSSHTSEHPSKPHRSFSKELESNGFESDNRDRSRLSKQSDETKETLVQDLNLPQIALTPPVVQPGLTNVPVAEPSILGGEVATDQQLVTQLKNHPVVSLLTGHLEKLVPQQIPNIVSQSKFLDAALSSENINEYLDSKQPVEKLLDLFGIEPSTVDTIKNNQMMISPREFLANAGIDVGRVAVEMGLLKDNLPLSGLTTYMIRSAKLRGVQGAKNSNLVSPPLAADQANAKEMTNVALKNEIPESDRSMLPNAAAERLQATGAAPKLQVPLRNDLDVAASSELGVMSADEPTLSDEPISPTLTKSNFQVKSPVGVDPTSNRPGLYSLSGLNLKSENAEPIRVSDIRPEIDERNLNFGLTPNELAEFNQNTMLVGNSGVNAKQAKPLDVAANLERMIAAQLEYKESGLEGGLSDGGDSQSQSQGGLFSDGINTEVSWNQNITGNNDKFDLGESIQVKSADSFAPVKQEIVKHSQMLVQNGGGSMKLNLDSKELGSIEISLDVKNDTVGMKLLVASDHVKEALVQDMSKLRDALSSHNLDLKHVEFDFSDKRHDQQGSFAEQRNSQADQFLGQSNKNIFSNLRTLSRGAPAQIRSMQNSYVPYRAHSGSIQVVA